MFVFSAGDLGCQGTTPANQDHLRAWTTLEAWKILRNRNIPMLRRGRNIQRGRTFRFRPTLLIHVEEFLAPPNVLHLVLVCEYINLTGKKIMEKHNNIFFFAIFCCFPKSQKMPTSNSILRNFVVFGGSSYGRARKRELSFLPNCVNN